MTGIRLSDMSALSRLCYLPCKADWSVGQAGGAVYDQPCAWNDLSPLLCPLQRLYKFAELHESACICMGDLSADMRLLNTTTLCWHLVHEVSRDAEMYILLKSLH